MTNLTHTTNKALTDLLKVVLPEYEIKGETFYTKLDLRTGKEEQLEVQITLHTLIDLLSGKTPKILGGDSPQLVYSREMIGHYKETINHATSKLDYTLLAQESLQLAKHKILTNTLPKTIAQFFLRENIESGRVLTDFEGVCLELIEIIKTNYNLR